MKYDKSPQMPLVSIGLPAFKGAFFKDALVCWKQQTYEKFEVLVYDDASPDDLKAIFDEVCGDDPRFSHVRNAQNTSPHFVSNWNKALEAAKGELFVLGSDDDLFEPTFLEEMVKLTHKYPSVDLFYCRKDNFNTSIDNLFDVALCTPEYESHIDYLFTLLLANRGTVAPNYMVRKAAIDAIGGFVDLPAAWASDWVAWAKLSINGVVSSPKILFHFRLSGMNISTIDSAYWSLQKINAWRQAIHYFKEEVLALKPTTAAEHFQKAKLLEYINTGYWKRAHLDEEYVSQPFHVWLNYHWTNWRLGELALRRFLAIHLPIKILYTYNKLKQTLLK